MEERKEENYSNANTVDNTEPIGNSFETDEPSGAYENSCDTGDGTSQSSEETESPSESLFYFESDHVALKGNRDYQLLLRTVALLEAQRVKAIEDLDKLIECEKTALGDPIGFVEKLQRGADVGIPKPQKVASVPNIHWDKYITNVDPVNLARRKHMTRTKRQADGNLMPMSSTSGMTGSSQNTSSMDGNSGSIQAINSQPRVIRGRLRDESKPQTFNQLWTAEEQRHLEELLIQYPPEEVEARRWDKIAKALGNRTSQQVASRVQKYFIKLAKAGLPIPGRMPNLNTYLKKTGPHRHQRYNKFYFQPSTFLTSHEPPVYMSDDEDGWTSHTESSLDMDPLNKQTDDVEVSDEEDIPRELQDTEEYRELMRLKKLKKQQIMGEGPSHLLGYKCDLCGCEPIVGTRWHCVDCPPDLSVDFCQNCFNGHYETVTHSVSHRLEPVQSAAHGRTDIDRDYTRFMTGDYNYLDPNYMPAS